jgi:hypothetical protein
MVSVYKPVAQKNAASVGWTRLPTGEGSMGGVRAESKGFRLQGIMWRENCVPNMRGGRVTTLVQKGVIELAEKINERIGDNLSAIATVFGSHFISLVQRAIVLPPFPFWRLSSIPFFRRSRALLNGTGFGAKAR